jgi:hypothetical protein
MHTVKSMCIAVDVKFYSSLPAMHVEQQVLQVAASSHAMHW